jgi:HlyD family secretion protein
MRLMLRKAHVLGSLAALLIAGALGFTFSRPPQAAVVQVSSAPLVRTLQFSGRVATFSRVEVGSTVTGRVAAVDVREGDAVSGGQVLLRLEDDEARATLAQAEATVRQAAARLEGLQGNGLDAAAALVAQADAQVRAAEADAGRARELLAQGFVGQARIDEAERAVAVARAQRAAAQAQRQGLAAGGSDIVQARAAHAAAVAAAEAARVRLAQTVVRSPAGGRVLSRTVEPGQIVQPGRALMTLALGGPLELAAQVDERFLEELAIGQTAAVVADAFAQQPFAATLVRIAPRVDAQRGSIELRFSLASTPVFLREDMTLSLEVTTARRESARVLPLAALRSGAAAREGDASRGEIWVVRDGRVRAQPVRLGLRTLFAVEVLDGLTDDVPVLVGPAPAPGGRVRPVAWVPPTAGARAGASEGGAAVTQTIGR